MSRLRQTRKAKGLTQKQLAQLLHTNQNNISRYETGQWQPNILFLARIASFLDVSVDFMLGKSNDMRRC